MTKAQQAMIEDGLPAAFIMTTQERHALWDANPPRNNQTFLDPRIEQDRSLREETKKEQTQKRIFALRASKGLIDVSRPLTSHPATQENDMAKYTIKPLDKHGHPVMRAITSINDDANEAQIEAKIVAAAERGGSKVVNVLLVNTLRQVVLAWEVKDGVAGPCDAGPFQPVEATTEPATDTPPTEPEAATAEAVIETETGPNEQESEVSKKVKKAKAPHKAKANGEVRKGSKIELVANLLKRKNGCTSAEVLKACGWPSVSMPAQAKQAGLKLRKDKVKGEVTRYFGS